jgi:hypothetical protein
MTEELAENTSTFSNLDIKTFSIDLTVEGHKEVIVKFLADRGSVLDETTVDENSFLLGNRNNDIWFQQLHLVEAFQQNLQYYYKYYEGPKVLPNTDFMLGACSNENDMHIVTYITDSTDKEQLKKTKKFR